MTPDASNPSLERSERIGLFDTFVEVKSLAVVQVDVACLRRARPIPRRLESCRTTRSDTNPFP
jgi:hypothetical protein